MPFLTFNNPDSLDRAFEIKEVIEIDPRMRQLIDSDSYPDSFIHCFGRRNDGQIYEVWHWPSYFIIFFKKHKVDYVEISSLEKAFEYSAELSKDVLGGLEQLSPEARCDIESLMDKIKYN